MLGCKVIFTTSTEEILHWNTGQVGCRNLVNATAVMCGLDFFCCGLQRRDWKYSRRILNLASGTCSRPSLRIVRGIIVFDWIYVVPTICVFLSNFKLCPLFSIDIKHK